MIRLPARLAPRSVIPLGVRFNSTDTAVQELVLMLRPYRHMMGRTFVGRGQRWDEEEMDRFGIVALSPHGGIADLLDGPLPAAGGQESLQMHLADSNADEPCKIYSGELDFMDDDEWSFGYFHHPTFGILGRCGLRCIVGEYLGVGTAPAATGDSLLHLNCTAEGEWAGSLPLSAIQSVQLALGVDSTQNLSVVYQPEGASEPQSVLIFSRDGKPQREEEMELESADEEEAGLKVVLQADWAVKCAAHLVLAARRAGGKAQLMLPPQLIGSEDNLYATLRDAAMRQAAME